MSIFSMIHIPINGFGVFLLALSLITLLLWALLVILTNKGGRG